MKARDLSRPILIVAILFSIAACQDKTDPPEADEQAPPVSEKSLEETTAEGLRIVRDEGPMPGADTILASGSDLKVTLGDFERAMRRSLLFAPEDAVRGGTLTEVPPERMAMPHVHITATQNLVARKIVMAEAEKHGLTIEPADEIRFFAAHPTLSRFASLFESDAGDEALEAELEVMGLDIEDLRVIAHEELLSTRLEEHLMGTVDDDQLWEAYKEARDTVDLLVAAIPNTPSSQEIDQLMELDAGRSEPRIDAYFRQNRDRYVSPAGVRLTMLKAPAGQPGPDVAEKLQQAERRLASGEAVQAAASGLGLQLEENALLLQTENSRAFSSKIGEIGHELTGPRGAYTWRVEGHEPSKPLELTRPLRREIAAEMLRQSGILPSVKARQAEAAEQLRKLPAKAGQEAIEALAEELQKTRISLVHTGPFPRASNGYIPRLGLAEEVMISAFELTLDEPVTDEPVLSRGRAHVLRLMDRQIPTRAEFDRDRDEFLEAYIEHMRPSILHDLLMTRQDELGVEYDVRPLRVKYGVIAKD